MIRSAGLISLTSLLLLAGCGEPSSDTGSNDPKKAAEAKPTTECQTVKPAGAIVITEGLNHGAQVKGPIMAVKSADHDEVYYIAANLTIPGAGEEIGVWAKSGPLNEVAGLTFSVDGIAKEFSDWGPGEKTDAALRSTDEGATEARSCVESL